MNIGLIDVDGHNFPNLALMKISAYHKGRGDTVNWCNRLECYDAVYKSRVFTDEYTADDDTVIRADWIYEGGTGYNLKNVLPREIEHQYPDYLLYPQFTEAYGFLTRGCPRGCKFCIVGEKEGKKSVKVADLAEFWNGQKKIKLLDPNLLACTDHPELLRQLIKSGAHVDFTQGIDARLLTQENTELLRMIKTEIIHFAWDNAEDEITPKKLEEFKQATGWGSRKMAVYVLTNYGSTHEQDLYRVYRLVELGYDPYIMIYNKPQAPKITRHLQRWVNNKVVFKAQPDFSKYDPRRAL